MKQTLGRKLLPLYAVAIVLVVAFASPVPIVAGKGKIGGDTNLPAPAGQANNCGVKGDGYHDHGKPCPNRPFPGHNDR